MIKHDQLSLVALANFPTDYDWADRNSRKDDETGNSKRYPGKTGQSQSRIRCHHCGELGHKSTYCQEEACDPDELNKLLAEDKEQNPQSKGVMCFFC